MIVIGRLNDVPLRKLEELALFLEALLGLLVEAMGEEFEHRLVRKHRSVDSASYWVSAHAEAQEVATNSHM